MGGSFNDLYKNLGGKWPTCHPEPLRPIREVLISQDRTWVSMIEKFYASQANVATEWVCRCDSEILGLSWGKKWLQNLQADTTELGKQRLKRSKSDRDVWPLEF